MQLLQIPVRTGKKRFFSGFAVFSAHKLTNRLAEMPELIAASASGR